MTKAEKINELTTLAKQLGCRSYDDVAGVLRDATGDAFNESTVRRWHKGSTTLPGAALYVLRQELAKNNGKPLMKAASHGRPGAFET